MVPPWRPLIAPNISLLVDYFGRSADVETNRFLAYLNTRHHFSSAVNSIYTQLTSELFAELVAYVRRTVCPPAEEEADDEDAGVRVRARSIRKELPTAALITGVNTPDHSKMFLQLAHILDIKHHGLGYVALLQSKDCQTLKSTLSQLITQLLTNRSYVEESEEDDDEHGQKSTKQLQQSASMQVLSKWYHSQEKGKNIRPIIIILEDIEMFNAIVLQDLIAICSKYLNESLPLMLVFGVATCVESVHTLLNHATSNLLTLQAFQLEASSQFLGSIIEKVILSESLPFKISANVFSLILDIFLYHDFSVNNFTNAFKLTMLYHYNNCRASFLCTSELDYASITKSQLKHVRELASYKKFASTDLKKDLLLNNDKYTKQVIEEMMGDLFYYHQRFYCILKCLCIFVRQLPGYPMGKQLRETYAICLENGVQDLDVYSKSVKLIRNFSRVEVQRMLGECVIVLTSRDSGTDEDEELTEIANSLRGFDDNYSNLDEKEKNEPIAPREKHVEELAVVPKRTKMHELRATLLQMADNKSKRLMTHHELLRSRCVDYLDGVFRKYLIPPNSMPLYEAVYYCDASHNGQNASGQLRRSLDACIRANVQRALADPYCYIKSEDLHFDAGVINNKLPDLCIAYKLHLECGKFINLYDWLQAFNMILERDNTANKTSTAQLQARFIRCVSELQFLGFIKPTKKKTDHVARLTWAT